MQVRENEVLTPGFYLTQLGFTHYSVIHVNVGIVLSLHICYIQTSQLCMSAVQ